MRSAQRFFTRWQNWVGLILVMVFRPTGILGQPTVEKV